MTQLRSALSGLLWITGALATAPASEAAAPVERQPDRVLTCALRHITNFDASKQQKPEELLYDSVHTFVLRLPPVRKLGKAPPEPFEKPVPVDPRTRIEADPDTIAPQPSHHFDRVVDQWPERVELSSTIRGNLLNAIVITDIDAAAGSANVFMLRATELTHFDPAHIYQGSCKVQIRTGAAH